MFPAPGILTQVHAEPFQLDAWVDVQVGGCVHAASAFHDTNRVRLTMLASIRVLIMSLSYSFFALFYSIIKHILQGSPSTKGATKGAQ